MAPVSVSSVSPAPSPAVPVPGRGAARPAARLATPAPMEVERPDAEAESFAVAEPDLPWITLVHNDPVNLMSYVTYVFQSYFGYSKDKATKLMLDVHNKGRAVVSSGSREEMERDVQAMHGYGLWATLQQDRD
ncbi:ATP-dependent Clp protease adaptor protein ClpS [Streptomyces sp. DfronAA-171]|nr:ATP-dependent Clp protease adaptor protein ClpS [Streptomyces sp. DfronAA-171]